MKKKLFLIIAVAVVVVGAVVGVSMYTHGDEQNANSINNLLETDDLAIIKTDDSITDLECKIDTSISKNDEKMLESFLKTMPKTYKVHNSFAIDIEMQNKSDVVETTKDRQTIIIKGTTENKIAPLFDGEYTDVFVLYQDGEELVPIIEDFQYGKISDDSIKMMFTTNKSGRYIISTLSEVE